MGDNDTGFNVVAANDAIDNVISGGAEVHILSQEGNYTDGSTEINNKSEKFVTAAEADFNIVDAADFTDTTKLKAANDIDFGATDVGIIVDVAVLSGERVIIGNEVNTPELTGEQYVIESGTTIFELGNV